MPSKQPPFTDRTVIDYEKHLLGAYILGAPIGEKITENVFYTNGHRTIFPVIRELKENGLDLDILILVGELTKRNKIDAAGGASYVSDLTTAVYSTANTSFYEDEVLKAHRGRSLYKAVTAAKENLEGGGEYIEVNETLFSVLDIITANVTKPEAGILFKDLIKKEFPPENWIIHELITTGLTVLTGASKIGKSWAAIQLVTALDQGGYFLGKLKAEKCDVLYMALEDTQKRIQKRIRKQGIPPFNGSRLEIKSRTVESLRAFLKANENFRVVIIDTFQKMMGISDLNDYAKTVTGMSALKAIADDLNRAVIVIHHNRKSSDLDGDHMESALGSTGINATADCTLTLRRKRGDKTATMQVSGRDIEDSTYTLAWDIDCCSWTVTEKEALKPSIPEAQQQIIDILESENRNWTTAEIIEKSGKSKQAVGNTLSRLKENGLILNPYHGQWRGKTSTQIHLPIGENVPVNLPSETETAFSEPEPELAVAELEIY